jgi:hypothetical protein
MTIKTITNGGTNFRIKRPVSTTSGFVSEVDETISSHLDELNEILGKKVFPKRLVRIRRPEMSDAEDIARAEMYMQEHGSEPSEWGLPTSQEPGLPEGKTLLEVLDDLEKSKFDEIESPEHKSEKPETKSKKHAQQSKGDKDHEEAAAENVDIDRLQEEEEQFVFKTFLYLTRLLSLPLNPKRVLTNFNAEPWDPNSILYRINELPDDDSKISLSDYIETVPALSKLKFQFQRTLANIRPNMEYNAKSVLASRYPAIIDYLVAHAFYVGKRREMDGLTNYILNSSKGVRNVANYASVSAARSFIEEKQLKVPGYNNDNSEFTKKLASAELLLSANSYKPLLKKEIDDFVFNSDEAELIEQAEQGGLGKIPNEIKPLLIKYIQQSPVPITQQNAMFFIPLFISQIKGITDIADTTEIDVVESAKDFDVQFLEDDLSMIQISQSAVKCAAQLYYTMVLGDELDVFGIVNYFTHKYLIRGGIEITDRRLREDLQMYVFSNKFIDQRTKKLVDRTRPAERLMFYRQVFSQGKAQITEDVVVNREFPKLWKVLMLESAEFLERAQASFHPDSFVSRQNVMQAVEDIQYNLSTHCTGMANVITPLIYAELDFVVRRIFMHPEILRQVVPAGGTWWRVVETLYMHMKKSRPKATVLYNKAKLGHEIIRAISEYNPSTFEEDSKFSAFISTVDAFITTQSILQDALVDDLKKMEDDDDDEEMEQNGYRKPALEMVPGPVDSGGDDEWDF